jgi:hypothetical protein
MNGEEHGMKVNDFLAVMFLSCVVSGTALHAGTADFMKDVKGRDLTQRDYVLLRSELSPAVLVQARLKEVTLFSHSIFTRRYIGFGGMMNAAPLLQPEWGWVQEYIRSRSQVP